jgi:type I restriction enzyme S subunit
MKADELRKSILQLAIQGKLVKQDPNDEPASILIEKIREEKQRLIKEGKIKKDKTESFIYKAADNSYYEKIGNETRCIDEEIPFDVPDGWEFCRLNFVCWLGDGEKLVGEPLPYLEAKYLRGKSDATILNSGKVVNPNTKVILVDGENSGEVFDITERGYIGSTFKTINIAQNIYERYIQIVLEFYKNLFRDSKIGAAIPHLNKRLFHNLIIAIPPLSEQKRIIDKLNTITPLLLKYLDFESKEVQLEIEFPERLKKSILQYAIQGALVAQNPSDEPASVLLDKIRREKEQLLKAGKIKKDKSESVIFKNTADNSYYEKIGGEVRCIDEEIPFEVPKSWAWARLGSICNFGKTTNIDSQNITEKTWVLDLEDIEKDSGILLVKKRKKDIKVLSTKHLFKEGNVLYSKLRPYLNKVIIADENGCCTSEILPLDFSIIYNKYAQIVLMSPYFVGYTIQCSYGVKMPRLGTVDGQNALFPVPPLSEQRKIVEKAITIFNVFKLLQEIFV